MKKNQNINEQVKAIIAEEAREVRLELGADFSKAVGFYKKVNGLTHLSIINILLSGCQFHKTITSGFLIDMIVQNQL